MVDALTSADRIVASLVSLLLEGGGSDICGGPLISRAFLRSVPINAHDKVLYLEEKSGVLQGWTLARRRSAPTYASGGAVQRLRAPGFIEAELLSWRAST
jgi:hypothetical protein